MLFWVRDMVIVHDLQGALSHLTQQGQVYSGLGTKLTVAYQVHCFYAPQLKLTHLILKKIMGSN